MARQKRTMTQAHKDAISRAVKKAKRKAAEANQPAAISLSAAATETIEQFSIQGQLLARIDACKAELADLEAALKTLERYSF